MQNIGYIIDKLLRNHIYKIEVIHWISYQPFAQPGPGLYLLIYRKYFIAFCVHWFCLIDYVLTDVYFTLLKYINGYLDLSL